ncbi:MAG: C-GCAxxG-C-C family protein [Bacteroidales bacterium]
MEKSAKAVETFNSGYNCAQSVLSVFAGELRTDRDTCLRIASPFGGGMAMQQETCGAVTGALMAIGLKFGKGEQGSEADKEHAYKLSRGFMDRLAQRHQSLKCRQLLDGLNMNDPQEKEEINRRQLFENRCPQLISDTVNILKEMMNSGR